MEYRHPRYEIEERIQSIKRGIFEMKARSTGKTIRCADHIIQQLYESKGEWITIVDHYPGGRSARILFNLIMRRMELEHPKDKLEVDKRDLYPRICLVSCPDREGAMLEVKRLESLLEQEKTKLNSLSL